MGEEIGELHAGCIMCPFIVSFYMVALYESAHFIVLPMSRTLLFAKSIYSLFAIL